MSIHDLPPQARRELKEVGWTKGLELAKVARRDGQEFDCATWLHKARSLPKDEFKREVEKELTGRETEPWEIIYQVVQEPDSGDRAGDGSICSLGTGPGVCARWRQDQSARCISGLLRPRYPILKEAKAEYAKLQ